MKSNAVRIDQIIKEKTVKEDASNYAVCWIKDEVNAIEINHQTYNKVSNSIFFLDPKYAFTIT